MSSGSQAYPIQKKIGLLAGPMLFLAILLLPTPEVLQPEAQRVLAVAGWMLCWWIAEAVNIAVTALLPIVLFPLMGIESLSVDQTTAAYGNKIIFLFMGGFVVALAMEKWNLHLRIALNIVSLTGTNANGIILGFMLATAFLSMWISNTATTVMMLPIATSIIQLLTQKHQVVNQNIRRFALCMMLGIAYAANIGGIATIIGTPPNTVFAGYMSKELNTEVDFVDWMMLGIPFSIIMLLIAYFFLVKVVYPNHLGKFEGAEQLILDEREKLGTVQSEERKVLLVFVCTALAWIGRKYINLLFPTLKLTDTGIAMTAAILLFVIPSDWAKGRFLLNWEDMKKLPWGILILFGGGLSLANAMSATGLIDLIGNYISQHNEWAIWVVVLVLASTVLFMTELMSNVALITIFLPVLTGVASGLEQSQFLFAIPCTIAASCAFMLPMATPPNAIVFASGHVKVAEMAKAGFWLNLIAIVLLMLFVQTFIGWLFL